MIPLSLFQVIPQDFFKVLTSKYKDIYVDCLLLIYNSYKNELSFGVDKEIILNELENYFENKSEELIFDEDSDEVAKDARAKANAILLRLKNSGWIEYDQPSDFRIRVNLMDYAITMIETFYKIISNEEVEYQSQIAQIYSTLINEENYNKPYEYILKSVSENTETLITKLKKLNTNIKKYIEMITHEKTATEIVRDFFTYQSEIGSKAYHRLKTSDHVSNFRNTIIERLRYILNDEQIFQKALSSYIEIEEVPEGINAESQLRSKIQSIISAFINFDDITSEIDFKHSRYMSSAIARAKFLLNNTNNVEGKVSSILNYLAQALNEDKDANLNDLVEDDVLRIFSLFAQAPIDSDSLYVVPITKTMALPDVFSNQFGLTQQERDLRTLAIKEQNKKRFSLKNINNYVQELLDKQDSMIASSLAINSKRELIQLIFIHLYGRNEKSMYTIKPLNNQVVVNGFRFNDFIIERIK